MASIAATDHGGHWERLSAPKPGLAVWSLQFHPRDPDVIFAGYEPYAIYRSDNGGKSWDRLPMDVTFPDVTVRPVVSPKRILDMAIDPAYPMEMYAAVEVGGLLRSLDGGEKWESVSEGYYVNDDPVDMHGVAVSAAQPRTVFTISRIGMWRSPDRGEHWQHVQLEMLSPRGTYCRDILVAPDDPRTMYCAAGPAFRSEEGALFAARIAARAGAAWTSARSRRARCSRSRSIRAIPCTSIARPAVGKCFTRTIRARVGRPTRCPMAPPRSIAWRWDSCSRADKAADVSLRRHICGLK